METRNSYSVGLPGSAVLPIYMGYCTPAVHVQGGVLDLVRTGDLRFRKALLYPAELRGHCIDQFVPFQPTIRLYHMQPGLTTLILVDCTNFIIVEPPRRPTHQHLPDLEPVAHRSVRSCNYEPYFTGTRIAHGRGVESVGRLLREGPARRLNINSPVDRDKCNKRPDGNLPHSQYTLSPRL